MIDLSAYETDRVRIARFLRPVFYSEPRAQHISGMYSKFALRPHHVWKYAVDIQSPSAEIRRGKKKKKKIDRNHRAKV